MSVFERSESKGELASFSPLLQIQSEQRDLGFQAMTGTWALTREGIRLEAFISFLTTEVGRYISGI